MLFLYGKDMHKSWTWQFDIAEKFPSINVYQDIQNHSSELYKSCDKIWFSALYFHTYNSYYICVLPEPEL